MKKGFTHERGHQGGTNTWLTPKSAIDACGRFDLDPCAAPEPRPWPSADRHIAEADGDGLAMEWSGLVWCNPPYGPNTGEWLKKLASHRSGGGGPGVRQDGDAGVLRPCLAEGDGDLLLGGAHPVLSPRWFTGRECSGSVRPYQLRSHRTVPS